MYENSPISGDFFHLSNEDSKNLNLGQQAGRKRCLATNVASGFCKKAGQSKMQLCALYVA
jgi:hypothetical protein